MKVLVTGGSGFIGARLTRALLKRGDAVTVLSRSPRKARRQLPSGARVVLWDGRAGSPWCAELSAVDAVVHLAGAPVAARWSKGSDAAKKLDASRGGIAEQMVEALAALDKRPAALVSASAIGFYGINRDGEVDENDAPGDDHLAAICTHWEDASKGAEALGIRTVQLRIGVALGAEGGALQQMVGPGGAFAAGLGRGDNWLSWVHVDDVVGMILFALDRDDLSGPLNAVAPEPAKMRTIVEKMGMVMNRPALRVPAFLARVMLQDAVEVIVGSARVRPARAKELGYRFRYPTLLRALEAELGA